MIAAGACAGRRRLFASGGVAAALLLLPAVLLAQVDTAWVRRYDGPAHGSDWANCLAVDSAGNVYVAGPSQGSDSTLDWVTIKYSPTGDSLWAVRHDFGGNDIPIGLGVDGQGNVYVTGSGNSRMATVKYDSAGRERWVKVSGARSGAGALLLDEFGRAVICGSELRTSSDRMVVKYNAVGDTLWVRYHDWAGYEDDAIGVALNAATSLITVTGSGYDGNPGCDYVTTQYDSAGNLLWIAAYDGPADWDAPTAVAVDEIGRIVVTGMSEGLTSPWDYLTIKCSPDGETLWTRRYDGPASGRDQAVALVLDGDGSIVVTGNSAGVGTIDDFVTIKYDTDGNEQWVARYDGPGSGQDKAYSVDVDSAGSAYVTGGAWTGQPRGGDCATIKYNLDGDSVWCVLYNGPNSTTDEGRAIAVGCDGAVYVAGNSDGIGYNLDMLVIKYIQPGAVAERPAGEARPAGLVVSPNPFTNSAGLQFWLPVSCRTSVRVHDVTGRAVRTIECGTLAPGSHMFHWDGTDDAGAAMSAGVYLVSVDCGARVERVRVLRCR